jgi:hypothetical protein
MIRYKFSFYQDLRITSFILCRDDFNTRTSENIFAQTGDKNIEIESIPSVRLQRGSKSMHTES